MTQALIVSSPQTLVLSKMPRPAAGQFTIAEIFGWFKLKEGPRYHADEGRCFDSAFRIVLDFFGDTPAAEFGPMKLRIVREAMIESGWSRKFINNSISRIRVVFRYAVSWEMIPPAVLDSLAAVSVIRRGDTKAREPEPRTAVPEADLQAVRAKLCERHRDIFDLLLCTGCRPGELLGLTTEMIDRTKSPWRCDLRKHKTLRYGKSRFLLFNTDAQLILRKYFQEDEPKRRLFLIRRDTFSAAVKAACVNAGVPVFTPHWLRHTVATRLVDEVGLEATQQLLGHSNAAQTAFYSLAASRLATAAVEALQKMPKGPAPEPQVVPVQDKLVWTVADVIAVSGLSKWTVFRLMDDGLLPSWKEGRQRLFDPAIVRALLVEDREAARQKIEAVREKRRKTPAGQKRWTPEEDAIVMRFDAREAAEKLGRKVQACRVRRWQLEMWAKKR